MLMAVSGDLDLLCREDGAGGLSDNKGPKRRGSVSFRSTKPGLSGDSWMYPYQRTPMGNPYISPIYPYIVCVYGLLLSPRIPI